MPSLVVPIMPDALHFLQADLECREQDLRLSHFLTNSAENGVVALTSISYFSVSSRFKSTMFATFLDKGGGRQVHLPRLAGALQSHELYATSFECLATGRWLVGAAKSVVAPSDGVTCALFVLDELNSEAAVRCFPNAGSRFRAGADGAVFSTLHHNLETRHSVVFDDGVCKWTEFRPTAELPDQLGSCRLVADLSPPFDADSPWLSAPRPFSTVLAQLGWDTFSLFTEHIEPLPDGAVLLSVWNTARNVLVDFTYVVAGDDGVLRTRFENVEPRSRMVFSECRGWFVNVGETQSKIFDRNGSVLASVENGPGSRPRYKRSLLRAVWPGTGLVFDSRWLAQTNSVLVYPEPVDADPTEYIREIQLALAEHDKEIRKRAKSEGALHYRFTVSSAP